MSPDSGPGIPGWFIALFVLLAVAGIGTTIWRVSVARSMARDAGLDPNRAAAITLSSDGGMSATYLASALAPRPPSPATDTGRTPAQRLEELQALRDKGLLSDGEFTTARQKILDAL